MTHAMTPETARAKPAAFVWDDPFLLDEQLTRRGADDPRQRARLCPGPAGARGCSRRTGTRPSTARS